MASVGPVDAAAAADRRPYKVEYYKDGKKHVINRRPPPKLHDMRPDDEVTINTKRNADWDVGDTVYVKAIQPRQPNTLTVEKDDGSYTFLAYYDVDFEGRETGDDQVSLDKVSRRRDPIGSDYLLWP